MRTVSALRPLWGALWLIFILLTVLEVAPLPVEILSTPDGTPWILLVVAGVFAMTLLIKVAPRSQGTDPVRLASPVRGEWTAVNSPGQKLPSHGTRTRGQYGAVDLCLPSDETCPPLVQWKLLGNRPQDYPGFGAPIYAMADGAVSRVRDRQRDHRARNTWPALMFMMTVEGLFREIGGTPAVLGNHVILDHGNGTSSAYAHIKNGSATVKEGQQVAAGEVIGEIGNTGNTSMPHLHVQLMDRSRVDAAAGIPMIWTDIELHGELDPLLEKYAKAPSDSALEGMPRNGEIFTAEL